MNIWPIMIPASLAGIVIYGAARSHYRTHADLPVAIKLGHDLFPYINGENLDPEELWAELGCVRGLRRMLRYRRTLMLTGRDLAIGGAGRAANGLWKDIVLCGFVLWWVGWAAILIEAPIQAILRRYSLGEVPRILAKGAVELYCAMCTSLSVFTVEIPTMQVD